MTTARPFLMFQGGSAQVALDLSSLPFLIPAWCELSATVKVGRPSPDAVEQLWLQSAVRLV